MNKLFNRLVNTVRKQRQSAVVPFSVGRIYQTTYRNWKHDPKPLVLIIGSDSFYTVGINLNYVVALHPQIERWILALRESGKVLTGKTIYDLLKMRLPLVPRNAYRKYFTSMLRGRLVSSGLYTGPEPTAFVFNHPFIRRLNQKINAQMNGSSTNTYRKSTFNKTEMDGIRDDITASQYDVNSQMPFRQKTVVQYRQPEGGE
jgi:hypothetical protein